jgi:hypothetical protein
MPLTRDGAYRRTGSQRVHRRNAASRMHPRAGRLDAVLRSVASASKSGYPHTATVTRDNAYRRIGIQQLHLRSAASRFGSHMRSYARGCIVHTQLVCLGGLRRFRPLVRFAVIHASRTNRSMFRCKPNTASRAKTRVTHAPRRAGHHRQQDGALLGAHGKRGVRSPERNANVT